MTPPRATTTCPARRPHPRPASKIVPIGVHHEHRQLLVSMLQREHQDRFRTVHDAATNCAFDVADCRSRAACPLGRRDTLRSAVPCGDRQWVEAPLPCSASGTVRRSSAVRSFHRPSSSHHRRCRFRSTRRRPVARGHRRGCACWTSTAALADSASNRSVDVALQIDIWSKSGCALPVRRPVARSGERRSRSPVLEHGAGP